MSNNITLNIVEPGSGPTPDPVVPNTGLFTSGIGGPEATAIGTVLVLTIAAIVVAVCYRKQKKSGKVTKLVHVIDSTRAILKSKKRITAGLSAIALLASAGTLTTLLANAGKSNTNAIDGEATAEAETITPTVSGNELTVELGSEPVFAVLPVDITVEEEMPAGYTLTAYTDNTDLVSTTDSSKVIPMVAIDEGELDPLTDNTYGLALAKPESKDEEAYTTLSTDADNPTFITDKDYEATEANDTTTIYYGFYITPDVPYGTYTGSDIDYDVEANRTDLAKVIFDGNGLTFDGGDTNIVRYEIASTAQTERYSHTPNISDAGVQDGSYPLGDARTSVVTIPGASSLHVKMTYGDGIGYYSDDFVCFWSGALPTMTATSSNCESGISVEGANNGKYIFNSSYDPTPKNSIEANINDNSSVTFAYVTTTNSGGSGTHTGYGYYAVVTGFDENGDPVYLDKNLIVAGNYKEPSSSAAYKFLGWSTEKGATAATYSDADDIMNNLSISAGDEVTLYAVWQPLLSISYNGNGADSTTDMDNVEQYTTDLESTEKQVDLLASNFKKDGYGFAGWSTDQDAASKINNAGDDKPTIYGPNQTITLDEKLIAEAGENRKLVLNAVWVSAETNVTMQTFNPNSEPYASKPNGTVIALEDERDNQVYAVAKLADGNYWMIENLRLDNEPELSTTNTHNPSLPLTNNYSEGTTSNFLSATGYDWCTDWDGAPCYDQSKLNTNNVASTATSPVFSQDFTNNVHDWNTGSLDANVASYGNYYNWYSATAGNGTYDKSSGEVAGDICPAGWILPIGNETEANGSFSHLDVAMGGTGSYQRSTEAANRWRSFPNNFVYSGFWYGSSAGSRGGYGGYWSSTAYATSHAYSLYFNSGNVYPGTNSYGKLNGFSVRCVAPVE